MGEVSTLLAYDDYVGWVRREGAALAAAARAAGVNAPVPQCPPWTVADLLSHQGRIHHWVARIFATRPAPPPAHWSQDRAPGADRPDELLAWFDAGVDAVASALEGSDAGTDVWFWSGEHRAGLWARRMAHETAVHRWDAESAAGAPAPIDPTLAVDGVQEFFDVLPLRKGAENVKGDGETIHFHSTDGDGAGEWLVTLVPDGFRVAREHAKGDVAARGSASDIELFLWGRVGTERFEVFGDASLLDRWREVARF
jgi:uncharacterized protein (TIGR03083 family)